MIGFIKWLMYFLCYIVITLVGAFLCDKIGLCSMEQAYSSVFLGVLASEVASIRVNIKEV